ncbi:MAG: signal peptidase I [Actinobacteria bacterium]|nr:signal peptidase I [Actinomycetota bacterium]
MSQSETVPEQRRRSGLLVFLRDLLVILVVAFLISFLLKTFLVRSFYIPSGSMEHTLEINDRVLVNQLVPKVVPVKRGDIVVFRDPGGWLGPSVPQVAPGPLEQVLQTIGLAADTSNDYVIKRVIGLPGDHVVCCDAQGRVSINGVSITEPYVLMPSGQTAASGIDFDVTVPAGKLWMMGDNRYNSADSRFHMNEPGKGFLPEEDVVGRAFLLNWPLNRFTWLGDYPEVFAKVPEPSASGE